jgi:hypothetical protein
VWFLLYTPPIQAQQPPVQQATNAIVQMADSVLPVFKPLQDFAPSTATAQGERLTKSPVLAAALSLVAGAGQVYVGSYWKAGLFFGGWAFCAWQTVTYHNQFQFNGNKFDARAFVADSLGSTSADSVRTLRLREVYHDLRDTFFFVTLGVSLFAAIDAYTGAHLYDFDVTDDLKASLYIAPMRVTLALRW